MIKPNIESIMSGKKYAVITGDIVNSTKLNLDEREMLLNFLKVIFSEIEKNDGKIENLEKSYTITRGDSFQIIIQDYQMSLKYSLLIRSGLRKLFHKDVSELCDARISIGIGRVEYWGETISECDGDVFRFSGRNLDQTKNKRRLLIKLYDENLTGEIDVNLTLLDSIIIDWSYSMAQMVYEKLLEPKQSNIAEKFRISASAISRRLNSAHWDSIDILLKRFEKIIK